MENIKHNVRLTGPEISALWTQYLNDSMAICVLTYALESCKDKDIYAVIEFALSLSKTHINKITEALKGENYPSPKGFTMEDVNLNAPPLFSETFWMQYLYVMTLHGMNGYSLSVGTSVRGDQREYFMKCNKEAMELYDKLVEVMLDKGIFSRSPFINAPHEQDVIDKQSYLTGWFGKRRPLNGIEMGHLYYNMQKTIVKIDLEIAFAQVTTSKELREYFQKGAKICKKHISTFNSILTENDLPSPRNWTSEISNTTIAPFSNKLMLFHVASLIAVSVGYYGTALSVSQRRDIIAQYLRLMGEIGIYAEDGINLMIKNSWLEQPPSSDNRDTLAKKNHRL
ncbi:DUF3231 family protein [Metabacillus litoralis]|uniref:DUF3231 family protein n=1 Tax=Metabacillus litoralis TaxID=152268 RepID=UPI001CFD6175|nr:DUF3231 family protein [Metabacillus litoralis]